jgi:hypothetical protein
MAKKAGFFTCIHKIYIMKTMINQYNMYDYLIFKTSTVKITVTIFTCRVMSKFKDSKKMTEAKILKLIGLLHIDTRGIE